MSKVRVAAFSVSLDGFGAGSLQDLQNPLGVRGLELHTWFVQTEAFTKMHGQSGGKLGVDSDVAAQSFENIGAWILGRNMFGPIRGPWKDDSWKAFHFVTDGIQAALMKAKEASGGKDVRIGGGVSTIRQYLAAGLIDEMHLAFAPVLLGQGEHLFSGINLHDLGFVPFKTIMGENAMHVVLRK